MGDGVFYTFHCWLENFHIGEDDSNCELPRSLGAVKVLAAELFDGLGKVDIAAWHGLLTKCGTLSKTHIVGFRSAVLRSQASIVSRSLTHN